MRACTAHRHLQYLCHQVVLEVVHQPRCPSHCHQVKACLKEADRGEEWQPAGSEGSADDEHALEEQLRQESALSHGVGDARRLKEGEVRCACRQLTFCLLWEGALGAGCSTSMSTSGVG